MIRMANDTPSGYPENLRLTKVSRAQPIAYMFCPIRVTGAVA